MELFFYLEILMEVLEFMVELFVVKCLFDVELIILIYNLLEKEVSYLLDSGVYINFYMGFIVIGSDFIKFSGYEFCWLKIKNYREE